MVVKKRDENAQSRQRAILKHSLAVFAKEGFHGADVQVIADLARVGKGTVYRHFGNKQSLFLATARHCVEWIGEFVDQKIGGEEMMAAIVAEQGAAEVLRRVAMACAEFYKKYPSAVEIMIMERAEFRDSVYPTHLMYRAERRDRLDAIVAAGVASGEFRPVNPTSTIDAYADLLFGSFVNGCIGGSRDKLTERITASVEIFVNGLLLVPQHASRDSRRSKRNSPLSLKKITP